MGGHLLIAIDLPPVDSADLPVTVELAELIVPFGRRRLEVYHVLRVAWRTRVETDDVFYGLLGGGGDILELLVDDVAESASKM